MSRAYEPVRVSSVQRLVPGAGLNWQALCSSSLPNACGSVNGRRMNQAHVHQVRVTGTARHFQNRKTTTRNSERSPIHSRSASRSRCHDRLASRLGLTRSSRSDERGPGRVRMRQSSLFAGPPRSAHFHGTVAVGSRLVDAPHGGTVRALTRTTVAAGTLTEPCRPKSAAPPLSELPRCPNSPSWPPPPETFMMSAWARSRDSG
jgi:hypothetical protein